MRETSDEERVQSRRKGGYEGQEVTEKMVQAVVHDAARQRSCRTFWTTCVEGLQSGFYTCEEVMSNSRGVDENDVR